MYFFKFRICDTDCGKRMRVVTVKRNVQHLSYKNLQFKFSPSSNFSTSIILFPSDRKYLKKGRVKRYDDFVRKISREEN